MTSKRRFDIMKKKGLLCFVLIAMLAAALAANFVCASAQTDESAPDRLCVTGYAEIQVKADECSFGGSIHVVANDLSTAQKECESAAQKIMEAFAPYGSVTEEHAGAMPLGREQGYSATRYFTFTTKSLDKLSEMRTALANAGISDLEGTRYTCSDDSAARAQALKAAIEDARKKAETLGAEGTLVRVEETCCYPRPCGGTEPCVYYTSTVRAVFAKNTKND